MQYEILFEKLINAFGVSEEKKKALNKRIRKKEIFLKNVREYLCHENQISKRAFYILEGTVGLSVKEKEDEITICQLNAGETVNLEILFNNWRCKNTAICISNTVSYIVLNEEEVLSFAENNLEHIYNVMQMHVNYAKQIISAKSPPLLPNVSENNFFRTGILKGRTHPLLFPEKPIKKTCSEIDLQSCLKRERHKYIPNTYELLRLQDFNLKTLERTPTYEKSEINVDYLIRMNIKKPKAEYRKNRHEKLFKDYLKNIVNRKIKYEQKHFKVIKNQKMEKYVKVFKDLPEEKIENYFNV